MENQHVNATGELLIWVDENDIETGCGEKMETHRLGQLHRAFSLFLYDPESRQVLLQKRAQGKYHSGGLWSNSCCSHPRKNETFCSSVSRCLREELGIDTDFQEIDTKKPSEWILADNRNHLFFTGRFQYFADYGELSEHEMDHVLILCRSHLEEPILFNTEEASEVKWVTLDEIDAQTKENPAAFSAWFARAYQLFRAFID